MMLAAAPLLPLLAAIISFGYGHHLRWGGGELVIGATAIALIVLLLVSDTAGVTAIWFASGGMHMTVGLEATPLTRFVATIVSGTALGVGIYSLGYMAAKPNRPRFFAEIGLFVGAMLTLVLSSSLVLLFAAWELVGVASYLLIGFNHGEAGAPHAAGKAFLMTRIGDVGLLLGWLMALGATGTTEIDALTSAVRADQFEASTITVLALLLLAGAIGKSAQLPLTAWLPDAMIGPTPVSALLHSATMVAAGVFLILRLYPVFEAAPAVLTALVWIGAATAIMAGLIATAETDLKRVLAWSTASQLGEMMIALGLGGPLAASFHLATHAAFKSTLFLAAGSVQESARTRALDRLGGLIRALPFTGTVFLLAALALAGVPPLSGFWSDETILAVAVRHGATMAMLAVVLFLLAGIYIGRATMTTFFGERRTGPVSAPEWPMCVGMGSLATVAAALGGLLAGRIGTILQFGPAPEPTTIWRIIAVVSAFAGLAFGAWRGSTRALGPLPAWLGTGLMGVTEAPALWTRRLGYFLNTVEGAFDRMAQGIAMAVCSLAAVVQTGEGKLDAKVAQTADLVCHLALTTEHVEALGFGRGGDLLALDLAGGGAWLRKLQAGPLYIYTLALFGWVTAALVVGGLMFWL
jgi:NADH-quinone oxidoreductase subunit L